MITGIHVGLLKPFKIDAVKRPVMGFDSEDDSKGTPTLFGFWSQEINYVTRHREDAINFLRNLNRPHTIVAHNLGYDMNNLIKSDDLHLYETRKEAPKLIECKLRGLRHRFVDSSSLFPARLEDMAPMVGVKKFEDSDRGALNSDYVLQDAKITCLFMEKFQDMAVEKFGVPLPLTLGQFSMNVFRKRLSSLIVTFSSETCLKAFYGGRVEAFYRGNYINKVIMSDINSSYPNVMRNKSWPDTSKIELNTSINTHQFGVGHFKIKVPEDVFLPVLPYKAEGGRLFFPVGEIEGYWTYEEVRAAIKYNNAEILEEYYGEGTNASCKPFTSFIDEFYNERLKWKDVSSGIRKKLAGKYSGALLEDKLLETPEYNEAEMNVLMYKLILNNLYGKLIQNRDMHITSAHPLTSEDEENIELLRYFKGLYTYRKKRDEPPPTANYMWGCYVTSYARLEWYKGAKAVHDAGAVLLYGDTDSIMYGSLKKSVLNHHKNKLGAWDSEEYDLAYFDQAKAYFLCNKLKNGQYLAVKQVLKGVPKDKRMDMFLNGRVTIKRPNTLSQTSILLPAAERRGEPISVLNEMELNYWRDIEKIQRSLYIKRRPENNGVGVAYPRNIKEIPTLIKEQKESEQFDKMREFLSVASSFRKNNLSLKVKEKVSKAFENTQVPEDWFDVRQEFSKIDFSSSVTYMKLDKSEVRKLKKGQIWFLGRYGGECTIKNEDFIIFYLEKYMNKKAYLNTTAIYNKENFYEDVKIYFFGNKKLEIKCDGNYIPNKPVKLLANLI